MELLDGDILIRSPASPPHSWSVGRIAEILRDGFGEGYHVREEKPFAISETSEPEPDAKVVKGDPRDYLKRKPGPRNVPLAIEVADNSLRRDRTVKKRIYSTARIPTYWIINLVDRCVEVYTDPTGPASKQNPRSDYRKVQNFGPDESLVLSLDGREVGRIAVSELLP